jgi:ATPase subunit of ABC transporter with duplicated ATPase domains
VPSLATLTARGVSVSFGATTVLRDVDVTVAPGMRVGVVGPNGVGKSTLLRVLAGIAAPDRGTVTSSPPTANVGYLPQEHERRLDETVADFLARRTGIAAAHHELDEATNELAAGVAGSDDRYATALDRWLALGGADFDARVALTLADLALSDELRARPMAALSGGQAARVGLAAILLARFDVFMLDEPTNDLDFEGLERLERFVNGLDAPLVVVSHDRAFLERTITAVLELDEHARTAARFDGGWHAYLDERATARRHAEEAYATYQDKRGDLAERARRQRQWAEVGVRNAKKKATDNDKNIRFRRAQVSERLAAKARATDAALARLDVVEKPWEGWDLRLSIADAGRSGDVVARLDGAVVHVADFTLGPVDLEVAWADRVAIVGPNGSGKTTLLRALLGQAPLDDGRRTIGPGVVVGEVEQARSRFNGDGPLLRAFTDASGLPTTSGNRSLLAKFGLGADHVDRPASTLSPGERTRAALALLQARGVNCLVLDEPTNHLDLPAIEQLEQALDAYGGTLLLVSHDREMLAAVRVDRVLDVADGLVTERR